MTVFLVEITRWKEGYPHTLTNFVQGENHHGVRAQIKAELAGEKGYQLHVYDKEELEAQITKAERAIAQLNYQMELVDRKREANQQRLALLEEEITTVTQGSSDG